MAVMPPLSPAPTPAPAAAPGARADATVPGVFRARAAQYGGREFLHFHAGGTWHVLSWTDAAERVQRIAAHLFELGVQAGDAVAILSANRYEWTLCDLAIQSLGAVAVPIYPTSTPRTVQHILRDSGSVLVFVAGPDLAAHVEVAPPLRGVIRVDGEVATWMAQPVSDALRAAVEQRLRDLEPATVATIIYTSGTTGDPKGVVLTHANFVEMAERTISVFPVTADDVILSWLPFSHVLERMDGSFLPLYAGATRWLARDNEHLMEDIALVRPTLMLGVPRIFEKVHEAVMRQVRHSSMVKRTIFRWAVRTGRLHLRGEHGPLLDREDSLAERLVLRPLRLRLFGDRLRCFMSGGAPLNEKVEEFFWVLGVKLMQGWGLTETTSAATTNTETVHRYRTVGKAIPGVELQIAADGEILVRGLNVMAGYWNHPTATAEVLSEDGWLKTGDLGFLDSDGFLTITDRKKDLIKTSGGKYVAPLPVEARLEADPLVASSMLVGDGRPFVVALIVPDFEALADDGFTGERSALVTDPRVCARFQAIVDAVNRDLASFESVKYFALVEREFSEAEGELTPTMKVKRRVVAEHFAGVIDEMYSRPKPE